MYKIINYKLKKITNIIIKMSIKDEQNNITLEYISLLVDIITKELESYKEIINTEDFQNLVNYIMNIMIKDKNESKEYIVLNGKGKTTLVNHICKLIGNIYIVNNAFTLLDFKVLIFNDIRNDNYLSSSEDFSNKFIIIDSNLNFPEDLIPDMKPIKIILNLE